VLVDRYNVSNQGSSDNYNQAFNHSNPQQVNQAELGRVSKLECDTFGLCSLCDVGRWYISATQGLSNSIYSSYKELWQSGNDGCRLCRLFVRELAVLDLENNYLSTLESSIIIQIILCSAKPIEDYYQDIPVLCGGNNISIELELCIDHGAFVLLRF
jgi:hypothetical protein